jgi:hypothetical protein
MMSIRTDSPSGTWRQTDMYKEFEAFKGIKTIHVDGHKRILVPLPRDLKISDPIRSKRPPKLVIGLKQRFHVIISWYGELHHLWGYAVTAEQMLVVAARRLAPKVRYSPGYVVGVLSSHPGWWEVRHE